jgi:hypothetical protein
MLSEMLFLHSLCGALGEKEISISLKIVNPTYFVYNPFRFLWDWAVVFVPNFLSFSLLDLVSFLRF